MQAGNDGVHVNVAQADPTSAAHARREIDRLGAAGVVGLSLAGKPTLGRPDVDVAEPGSPPLRVPADGFAQVGRAGNAALVAAVMEAVGPSPGVVLELYAGSGNLTRHLVRARRDAVCAVRRRSGGDRARRAQRARGGLVAAAAGRRRPTPSCSIRRATAPTRRTWRPPRAPAAASSTSRAIRRRWSATRALLKAAGFALTARGGAGPDAADVPRRGRRDVRSRRRARDGVASRRVADVSDQERMRMRERPAGRAVMRQVWRHLAFLHWPVAAAALARLLPPGSTSTSSKASPTSASSRSRSR